MERKYLRRITDGVLDTTLEASGAVLIEGPKWCGKTRTAAENLKTLRDKVNVDKMREPSFLMVLTATELAYRRDDGVYIAPMGCLRH